MIYEEEIKSLAEGKAKGKRIVLMGRLEHLEAIGKVIASVGEKIFRIWDNDTSKQGGDLAGVPIEAPRSDISSLFVIIYSPRHWESMQNQLFSLGYSESDIYVLDRPTVARNSQMVLRGLEIYGGLCREYGESVQIFLASGPLGDFYLLGIFFHNYCRLHNVENYVIVGDSKGIGRISSFLELSSVCKLSAYDTASLAELWKFAGRDEGIRIKPLTIWQGDFRFNACILRQSSVFSFIDTVRYMIFALPEGAKPRYPKWEYNPKLAKELFQKNRLLRDKTVLLVPFSYSLASLPKVFWQELAAALINRGFVVAINAMGEGEKNFIEGTFTLSLSFSDVMNVMEHGAAVIGIRCGFFDITSQARCKRIVLYPPKASGSISWQKTSLDFCGLKVMGLCDDAYEWEVKDAEEIQQRILSIL